MYFCVCIVKLNEQRVKLKDYFEDLRTGRIRVDPSSIDIEQHRKHRKIDKPASKSSKHSKASKNNEL